jgi:hypothetical protein
LGISVRCRSSNAGWRRSTRLPLDDVVMHSGFHGQPQTRLAWKSALHRALTQNGTSTVALYHPMVAAHATAGVMLHHSGDRPAAGGGDVHTWPHAQFARNKPREAQNAQNPDRHLHARPPPAAGTGPRRPRGRQPANPPARGSDRARDAGRRGRDTTRLPVAGRSDGVKSTTRVPAADERRGGALASRPALSTSDRPGALLTRSGSR